MKLIEALTLLQRDPRDRAIAMPIQLVMGIQPLHLQTFLHAELRKALTARRPQFNVGLYGDFWGNLDRLVQEDAEAVIVVLEWGDLEPRLAVRNLGSWSPNDHAEMIDLAHRRCESLVRILKHAVETAPVVLALPTLPFLPVDYRPPWQAGYLELSMRALLADTAKQLASTSVRILNAQELEERSPLSQRFDVKSELSTGFPYTLSHASALSQMLVKLLHPPAPKKAIITDLDNTLWNGIVGEVGAKMVSWDLEHGSHMHGMYQRLLHALAESGVLIGVASKNASGPVEEALRRSDLLLPLDSIFPVVANWGAKSDSVAHILKTWNISADDVVFIDDSPVELAEVAARHPGIECLLFPPDDPHATLALFKRLREQFGKSTLSLEDRIRSQSLRSSKLALDVPYAVSDTPEEFLEQAEAKLTFCFEKEPFDERALELLNKTNQFNLNGRRVEEGAWRSWLKDSDSLLMVGSYRDKYGPLGKIMVLAARRQNHCLLIDSWVISCRAFSRRIEYAALGELFERTGAGEVVFNFMPTEKNHVIRDFLELVLGSAPVSQCRLSREDFLRIAPKTFHCVSETTTCG